MEELPSVEAGSGFVGSFGIPCPSFSLGISLAEPFNLCLLDNGNSEFLLSPTFGKDSPDFLKNMAEKMSYSSMPGSSIETK